VAGFEPRIFQLSPRSCQSAVSFVSNKYT